MTRAWAFGPTRVVLFAFILGCGLAWAEPVKLEKLKDASTERVQADVTTASDYAREGRLGEVMPEHMLMALLATGSVPYELLAKYGIDVARLRTAVQARLRAMAKEGALPAEIMAGDAIQALFKEAREIGFKNFLGKHVDKYLSVEHLLVALAKMDGESKTLLGAAGVTVAKLEEWIGKERGDRKVESTLHEETLMPIERFCIDVTREAELGKIDPVIGRDDEIDDAIDVLSRRTKSNPVFLAEPGVGKTAAVGGLAIRIVKGDVPEHLKGKKIVSLQLIRMVAGSGTRGVFEARLNSVLEAVIATKRGTILFVDELHTLVGAGKSEGSQDAANIMKPALARTDLSCIGATTLDEYKKYIEADAALERRFQPVFLNPPNVRQVVAILKGLRPIYEEFHNVRISDEGIEACATYSDRYIFNRFQPDKAIDLMDAACARVRNQAGAKPRELRELERKRDDLQGQLRELADSRDAGAGIRREALDGKLKPILEQITEFEKLAAAEAKFGEYVTKKAAIQVKIEMALSAAKLDEVGKLTNGDLPALETEYAGHIADVKRLRRALGISVDVVDEPAVAGVVERRTRIPVSRLRLSEAQRLRAMEAELNREVVGHEETVARIVAAIKRRRSGLGDPNAPMGSYWFLGPTGVGKSLLATKLAKVLFDDEEALLELSGGDFQEKHAASQLAGAPPGYVGYEAGGQLTNAVRRRPYMVVFFDEIDKAHKDVWDRLLVVMRKGKWKDAQGRETDFRNVVFVFASNDGAVLILDPAGHLKDGQLLEDPRSGDGRGGQLEQTLLDSKYKAEFVNRVDALCIFRPLSERSIDDIAGLEFGALRTRAADNVGLQLELTPAAKAFLVERGYSPQHGAGQLKRTIQIHVENPLANRLYAEGADQIKAGQLVVIDYVPGADGLTFTASEPTCRVRVEARVDERPGT